MHAAGWSRGLEVTGGGSGVVSHAGLVLLRQLPGRLGARRAGEGRDREGPRGRLGGRGRRQGPGPLAPRRRRLREPALRPPQVLDRGSARRRADRAAARGPGRRPARSLAQDDAGLRPPRAAPPRRATVPAWRPPAAGAAPCGSPACPPRRRAGAASAPASTPRTASMPASRT